MSDHEEAIAAETTSDPAITITSSTRSRKDSEQRLKQLLKEHHGSTKHAEVRQAIHELM